MLLYPFPCSYLAPSFFFNDTATTEIYTLSLHDALPISLHDALPISSRRRHTRSDRKSTRLNSSHDQISYAVFCLKKKKRRVGRSEEHTSELQSRSDLVCRLLLEIKKSHYYTRRVFSPTLHSSRRNEPDTPASMC